MHDGGSETEEEELDNAVLPAILFKFGLTLSSTVFSTMNVEHGQMRDDKKTEIMKHHRSSNSLGRVRKASNQWQ